MIILVTGGSASGKSQYAENRILDLRKGKDPLVYLATMEPYGIEGENRIRRHEALRAGKGFITVECYEGMEKLELSKEENVLVECVSNYLADVLYHKPVIRTDKEVVDVVISGLTHVMKASSHTVIVTNQVFEDGVQYDQETLRYIKLLGMINVRLAQLVDEVVEVVCGIPIVLKP